MITGSKELIRDINSKLVLESIIHLGPISRASLSKELGLTKATISAIVQELINQDLVIEIGNDNTEKGRKPILLKFNQIGGHVISIDLGVNYITILTSDLLGENCQLKHFEMTVSATDIIQNLISLIEQTLDSLPTTKHGVVGIAIGIHGIVQENAIIFAPYYGLANINIAQPLEHHFSIPVFLENEANLSVIGERSFCFDFSNIINISVHSGIGLGLILNNQLFSGSNGYAGEFGHSIIVPDGRACPCGNKGCFEQYASERALLQDFAQRKGLEKADINQLVSAVQSNDPDALAIIDDFVKYMSMGINNLLNIFNPDLIVINSSFTVFLPGLIDRITASIQSKMNLYCTLVPSGLQDTAILLGGVCVCIKNFIGVDSLLLNTSNPLKSL